MSAELYFQAPHNVVIAPSVHALGHQYLWTVTGDVPFWTWAKLKEIFKFSNYTTDFGGPQSPGVQEENPNAWKRRFQKDVHSLDILGLLSDESAGTPALRHWCAKAGMM